MYTIDDIAQLVQPIADDLTSGAAEIALRAINIFQDMLDGTEDLPVSVVKDRLVATARRLVDAQPAMAPLFHLSNTVLIATKDAKTQAQIVSDCAVALNKCAPSSSPAISHMSPLFSGMNAAEKNGNTFTSRPSSK